MSNIFNTPFEISLRVLLTLETAPRQWWSADWIAASDFISVYSGDFGIAEGNLHGENNFKYSEFALRRELVKEALKSLVSRQFIDVKSTSDGFVYALGKLGGECCADMENDYAQRYREVATVVKKTFSSKTDNEIIGLIRKYSISSIRRSRDDG